MKNEFCSRFLPAKRFGIFLESFNQISFDALIKFRRAQLFESAKNETFLYRIIASH